MPPDMNPPKITPMIQQYVSIKEQYRDYILFYRMGDFYEMFFDDAKTASRELEITLTSRNKNDADAVPMCGVPAKAADVYLAKLIEKGYKVAICDQTEDPSQAKGLVKRDVVRIVTPGMLVNQELLDEKSNNFVLAVCFEKNAYGISCLDISTGTFRVAQSADLPAILEEALRISPNEIAFPENGRQDPVYAQIQIAFSGKAVTYLPDHAFGYQAAKKRLLAQFRTRSLEGFGCEALRAGVCAAGAMVYYIGETQKQETTHIAGLETYTLDAYLRIDDVSCRNLELLKNLSTGGRQGTLLSIIDRSVTAMGGRLLKNWLRYPLLDREQIDRRLDAVQEAVAAMALRRELRERLKSISDLERLGSRVALGQAHARDLAALKTSICEIPEIVSALSLLNSNLYRAETEMIPPLMEIADRIEAAIVDDPPLTVSEGGMIRKGYHPELDELIAISTNGKGWLAELEIREKEKTGINSLKVRYNKVFGYYIEISKSGLSAVPDHYVRKQTLVNAERYITDELKDFEARVLGAEERRSKLEYQIFCEIRQYVIQRYSAVMTASHFIGVLDCLLNLAEVADHNDYCRPEINTDGIIDIEDGRHPVVETLIAGQRFVPNSIFMNNSDQQVLIITGPNMAGKSTVLRQVALAVLMAHMGSFVPAARASISVTDRIFTRVGALDNLSQGQSTFMVEMEETANILNHASPNSLVIMDEIGRGTSTFDGLSIAWAVAEFLHDTRDAGVKTLFATHYHELTQLARTKPRVKNFSIAVKEWNDEIIFLHKIVEGGTDRSYGIQVARLAGIPQKVVKRAKKVLSMIENTGHVLNPGGADEVGGVKERQVQLSLFRPPEQVIMEKLQQIDIDQLTPLEALNCLGMLAEKAGYARPDDSKRRKRSAR